LKTILIFSLFFFGESNILLDFYEHKPVVFFYDKEKQLDDFQDYYEGLVEEFSFHEEDFESYNLLPHPENLYSDKASVLFNSVNIKNVQLNVLDDTDHFPINFVNTQQFIHNELGFSQQTKSERRKNICTLIKKLLNKSYKVFFSYSDENNLSEFKHLLEVNNITPSHLEYIHSFWTLVSFIKLKMY
jgi:transcription-repair coupling factor (superfamily II helicase)